MTLFADIPNERLDAFLSRQGDMTRSAAQKLLDQGQVLRNGKPGKKNDRLTPGDRIDYEIPDAKPVDITPTQMALDIVYEDEDLLVINKPKGLVVHPAAGHQDDTLVNGLLYALGDDLSGINGELRPGIVHRIDKDTSGLLAVAKNDYAHTMLASQLKDHSMARTYEAIVCGSFREDSGTVDAPIGRHPTDRKKMCVTERNSKHAVTHWEVVARYRGYTHIHCKLETGRTHQIRVHMASIGHPFLEIWSTAIKKASWASPASASTPGPCASAIPGTAGPSWSSPPCPITSGRFWKSWRKWADAPKRSYYGTVF